MPGSFSTHFSTHFDIAVYDFQTATTNVCNYVEGKMQNRRTKKQAEIKLKKFDSRRVHHKKELSRLAGLFLVLLKSSAARLGFFVFPP